MNDKRISTDELIEGLSLYRDNEDCSIYARRLYAADRLCAVVKKALADPGDYGCYIDVEELEKAVVEYEEED